MKQRSADTTIEYQFSILQKQAGSMILPWLRYQKTTIIDLLKPGLVTTEKLSPQRNSTYEYIWINQMWLLLSGWYMLQGCKGANLGKQ